MAGSTRRSICRSTPSYFVDPSEFGSRRLGVSNLPELVSCVLAVSACELEYRELILKSRSARP